MQNHLKDYIQFKTSVDGIELLCLMEEYPGEMWDGRIVPCAVSCEYVLCDGRDITPLVKDGILKTIEERYLAGQNDLVEQAKLNRQLDALEDKQWNSTHS